MDFEPFRHGFNAQLRQWDFNHVYGGLYATNLHDNSSIRFDAGSLASNRSAISAIPNESTTPIECAVGYSESGYRSDHATHCGCDRSRWRYVKLPMVAVRQCPGRCGLLQSIGGDDQHYV